MKILLRPKDMMIGIVILAALFNASPARAQTAADWLERCEALYKEDDYRGAIEACDRALEEDPKLDAALNRRGWSRWKLKAYDQALGDFDAALRRNPRNEKAHLGRSNALWNLKRYPESLQAADAAIAVDPGETAAHVARGLALMELGRLDEAERSHQRALELNPKSTAALTNLGYLRRKAGDYQGAVAYYDRAIAIKPDHIDAHLNRGAARNLLGDTAGAIADASKVIELDPKDADAWANRGSAHLKKGDFASARRDLEKALALKPGHTNAAAKLKELGAKGATRTSVPASKKRIAFGDFSIEAIEGWDRAPAEVEREQRQWSFADLAGVGRDDDATPLVVAFGFESTAYGSEKERDAILRRYATGVKKDHPKGFEESDRLLAGRPARRLRFIHDDGTAIFYYAVDSGGRIHYVHVFAQTAAGEVPGRADELLSTLRIEGSAPVKTATTAKPPEPPQRTGGGLPVVTFAAGDPCAAAGYDASQPGMEQHGDKGFIMVPGREDTLMLCQQEPSGVLWTAPMDISGSMHAYFIGGDRFRHIVYQPRELMDTHFVFSGTTYIRAAPLADKPPVLPGHRWEEIVADAEKFEPGRIERMEKIKRGTGGQLQALLAVDPDNLPPPPIIRHEWEEGPHRADEKPPDCKCHVCMGGDGSRCPCRLCREDRKRLGLAEGPEPPERTKPADAKSPAADQEAVKETIAFHQAMIELLQRNLEKERADLERESDLERYRAMSAKEQEQVNKRRKELALRIIGIQSDIQAEADLAASYKTGTLVHTRSAFDEFAHQQFLGKVKEEAVRADQVRRIAAGVERQIELLPEEQKKPAREQAHRILDSKVIADGDVERAKRLAAALDNQIQGYWAGQSARQEEKAIAAEESEFYAQMAILASSACVVGFGSQAMAATFGEEAAITLWSPHLIGGLYGGMTGFVAGGLSPVEGVKGAVSNFHTVGGIAVNFLDGYHKGKEKPGATWQDAAWEGAKQAGFNFIMEKGFEVGAKYLVKGAVHVFGKESGMFQPLRAMPAGQRDLGRALRMTKDLLDGQDLINEFQLAQNRLLDARARNAAAPETAKLEAEARKLAATLNSSYHAKWLLKYKSPASVQRSFDGHIQDAYEAMTPEMLNLLKAQGYDTAGLEFRQLRNASSAGTASMDLDLALTERPGMVILKNGKPVKIAEFQKDAQRAMNKAYHTVTGYNATRSELNLTTSAHGEAYKNLDILKEGVDFTSIPPEDLAQIGDVLGVKLLKIEGDLMMSPIAKVQASCRESTKEIKNMLLPMLRQKLAKAPSGSPEAGQLKADITYWKGMLKHFNEIGTGATDPMRILELDCLIRRDTGGRGTMEVVHDLTKAFKR